MATYVRGTPATPAAGVLTALYTSTGVTSMLISFVASDTTTNGDTFKLLRVPSGGADGDSQNIIIKAQVLAAGTFYTFSSKLILEPGDALKAQSNGGYLAFNVSLIAGL